MNEMKPPEIDKTGWRAGPWMTEPDLVEFEHRGLPCVLRRNLAGCWCGYVGVPHDHPYHGKHYSKVDVNVHGGLTYAKECSEIACHETKTQDAFWWFGFDCGHSFDVVPGMEAFLPALPRAVYRDVRYVRKETEQLADQLAEELPAPRTPRRSRRRFEP